MVALLRKLAPLYNKLYDTAKSALVPLPGALFCWCAAHWWPKCFHCFHA